MSAVQTTISAGRMLNVRAASQLLNVSKSTLRRWGDQGRIEYWRISSRGDRRFKREDVERLAWQMFEEANS